MDAVSGLFQLIFLKKIKSLLKLVTSPHCIFVKKGSLIVSQFDLLGQKEKVDPVDSMVL